MSFQQMESGEDQLHIVSREVWDHEDPPPNQGHRKPASIIFLGSTTTFRDRLMQNVHGFRYMDKATDIEKIKTMHSMDSRRGGGLRYSFLISGEGLVYEGRGWLSSPLLPLRVSSMPADCLYITFIEPVPGCKPNEKMLEARRNLIRYGVANKFIEPRPLEYNMDNRCFWRSFRKFIGRR